MFDHARSFASQSSSFLPAVFSTSFAYLRSTHSLTDSVTVKHLPLRTSRFFFGIFFECAHGKRQKTGKKIVFTTLLNFVVVHVFVSIRGRAARSSSTTISLQQKEKHTLSRHRHNSTQPISRKRESDEM
uniref:(northern house mosquito) hypothetical protein n=1 Tax=Culex pipiens TaxID=7175 RepID=A0A8D8CW80_CULPI